MHSAPVKCICPTKNDATKMPHLENEVPMTYSHSPYAAFCAFSLKSLRRPTLPPAALYILQISFDNMPRRNIPSARTHK